MNRSTALARITEIAGRAGVVEGVDSDAMLTDYRRLFEGEAALVVRPASTAECAGVVAVCNEAGIGVVPQGGNTGYCGGAIPFDAENQVLLNLSRLNAVRAIDSVAFTMTVEAGVVLKRAQEVAAEHDLLFPLSMGSEGSCQIGGNLATNAGGISVLRYGTARDLVLGLEVILPNGEVVSELKGLRKDNTGYDLKSLFLGAEGTLGVITAAVLKLFPAPRSRQLAWIATPDVESACALLAIARRESADQVVSAEYVSRTSLDLVLEFIDSARDPLDARHDHYFLLELASAQEEKELRGTLERILDLGLQAGSIVDGVIADSGRQRDALWALRETIPEAERHSGNSLKHDISVRTSEVPAFIASAEPILDAISPHRRSIFGHIGDGNLHFNLLPAAGADDQVFSREALSSAVYDLVNARGGSFSAEHGIGVLKRSELERFKSPAALDAMRSIKAALDPKGIMNPGKVLG
ncbi:MAG: FAD-binding oxidoreductase [Gammaproteobacteria bacterium]